MWFCSNGNKDLHVGYLPEALTDVIGAYKLAFYVNAC